ncbi:hypothetical protein FC83_GL001419 [Agrilactobacillus composti DSM 18527 = JCM 14202]|uniref:Uncharacterized protein n=2 Tax=Agrilactobacillus TaxID=2767875 RepID=A0A0R1XKU7_9LACO|nr:hypothetical protein [Agrilactobacillus composti]KRM30858.1 hypothetical protein FC83_GL001419 [Agrilactobacillus composti DSM 18527 = JCM 14202]
MMMQLLFTIVFLAIGLLALGYLVKLGHTAWLILTKKLNSDEAQLFYRSLAYGALAIIGLDVMQYVIGLGSYFFQFGYTPLISTWTQLGILGINGSGMLQFNRLLFDTLIIGLIYTYQVRKQKKVLQP